MNSVGASGVRIIAFRQKKTRPAPAEYRAFGTVPLGIDSLAFRHVEDPNRCEEVCLRLWEELIIELLCIHRKLVPCSWYSGAEADTQ